MSCLNTRNEDKKNKIKHSMFRCYCTSALTVHTYKKATQHDMSTTVHMYVYIMYRGCHLLSKGLTVKKDVIVHQLFFAILYCLSIYFLFKSHGKNATKC